MNHSTHTIKPDPRPEVSVGHVGLTAHNFEASLEFFKMIGMRLVVSLSDFAVLELRGGTHLVLQAGPQKNMQPARFDLMVDNLKSMRARMVSAGLKPTPISLSGGPHSAFEVTDPSGILLHFTSSHVTGPV